MSTMITTDLGRHTAEMGRHFQYSVLDTTGLFMQPVAISLYHDPDPRNKMLGDIMESEDGPSFSKDDLSTLFTTASREQHPIRTSYDLFQVQFEARLREVLENGADRVGKPNHKMAQPAFTIQREPVQITAFRRAIEGLTAGERSVSGETISALGIAGGGNRLATVYTNKAEAIETALCNMLYNPRLPVKKPFSLDA